MTHGLEIRNSAGELILATEKIGLLPVCIEPINSTVVAHTVDLPAYAGRLLDVYFQNSNVWGGAVWMTYPDGIPRVNVDVAYRNSAGSPFAFYTAPSFAMCYLRAT